MRDISEGRGDAWAALDEAEFGGHRDDARKLHVCARGDLRGDAGQCADLSRPCARDFALAGRQMRGHVAQMFKALCRGDAAPRAMVKGVARGGNGGVHIGFVGLGHLGHHRFGVRAGDLDHPARVGRAPFTADPDALGVGDLDAVGQ